MSLPFYVLPTSLLMLFISQINGLPSKSYLRVCFQENPNITTTRKKLMFFPLRERGKPRPEVDLHFESPESVPSSVSLKRKIPSGLESWLGLSKSRTSLAEDLSLIFRRCGRNSTHCVFYSQFTLLLLNSLKTDKRLLHVAALSLLALNLNLLLNGQSNE